VLIRGIFCVDTGDFFADTGDRRQPCINITIVVFESKYTRGDNPLDRSTVGSISELSAKGALLLLRFHTGMRIN